MSNHNRSIGRLGTDGIEVSPLGIGCNAFGTRIDAQRVHEVVDAAFELGVTFFDTADSYGLGASETTLGDALRGRRDQVVLATKFGMDMQGKTGDDEGRRGSRDYVRRSIEGSLTRLGTDWIDLYQLHTPDRNTPLEETLEALSELVEEGLVRAIGCSNFQAWELVDAHWRAAVNEWPTFVTAQNEYSLYNRSAERELVPACLEFGIGILPYFPLAYGLLTGKYQAEVAPQAGTRLAGQPERHAAADWDRINALQSFADDRGLTLIQVALGGLAASPGVSSVIAGVTSAEQVASNVEAISWVPSVEDFEALAAIGAPQQSYTTYAPPHHQ